MLNWYPTESLSRASHNDIGRILNVLKSQVIRSVLYQIICLLRVRKISAISFSAMRPKSLTFQLKTGGEGMLAR